MVSERPLRIALILATPGTTWGGLEKHTAELAQALASCGNEVHVLAHTGYQANFSQGVTFHPVPFRLGRRNPWLKYQISRVLRSLKADICHAQGSKAASILSSVRPPGSSCLGTIHGTKSSHRAYQKLDGVIAISAAMLASVHHRQARLIHNGSFPPPETTPLAADPGNKVLQAVAIGRLEPVKGFDQLIRAWAEVSPPAHLTIYGDGRQRNALAQLIQHLGLAQSVTLAGYQSDAASRLTAADVCLISSGREGFPYVLIEALQRQCPVLSTPVSGAREVLPPEALASDDSVDALTTLLRSHLADLPHLRALEQDAFERARNEFSLDGMTSRTLAFYRELRSGSSG